MKNALLLAQADAATCCTQTWTYGLRFTVELRFGAGDFDLRGFADADHVFSRSAEHADHVFPVLQVREDSEAISEENECINEYVFTT